METIEFKVQKQNICTNRESLVSDTVNSYKCHFTFDSSWDGLNKVAVFVRGQRVIENIIIDNECSFADELLDSTGTICFGVYGTKDGVRYPTVKTKMMIIHEGVVNGVEPTPPSLEIWEQLLNMIVTETNRAKDTENALQNGLNAEIERATKRENEIENKIPSISHLATKEELENEKNARENADNTKADKSNTYTKAEVDEKISQATPTDYEQVKEQVSKNTEDIQKKQDTLKSSENIKTINGQSILGSGNIEIQSGASNYNDLLSKPQVNGVTLQGNKSLEELGIQPKGNYITDPNYTHTDNNFSNPLKSKLEGLENYDDTEIKESIRQVGESVPTKTSQLENDSSFAQIDDLSTQEDKVWSASKVSQRFSEVEMAKFPNVTIFGQPTINQGQISNFSATNYCQFPFIVNFQNQSFELDFEITTGDEVTQQHNVFDSQFGLAFAVRDSKFVLAISTNGTSWNIGEVIGSHVVLPNSTYRIRLIWDKANLTLEYSTDGGSTYVLDTTRPLTEQPYPKQMFIGITSDKSTFFNGIINLNYAFLSIANKLIWQGMDDVGLSTRADVSLSNLDDLGKQTISDLSKIQDVQVDGSSIVVDGNANIESNSLVKNVMTSTTPSWAEEEKANARERIGIGEWEDVLDITLEEDSAIEILFENEYKKLCIFVNQQNVVSKESGATYLTPLVKKIDGRLDASFHSYYPLLNSTYFNISSIWELAKNICYRFAIATNKQIETTGNINATLKMWDNISTPERFANVSYFCGLRGSTVWKANTRIIVKGVRA